MQIPVNALDVERAIADYLDDDRPENEDAHALARRHHALPLYLDWGGAVLLKPAGDLVFASWDEPSQVEVVTDPSMMHVARAVGAQRFPSVGRLEPERGPGSKTCVGCGGTGTLLVEGKPAPDNFVCTCGGLGWVP